MKQLAFAIVALSALAQAQERELRAVFDRYDKDGDGKVTVAEFPGSRPQFDAIDTNRDGQLTFEEFKGSAAARALLRARSRDQNEPRPRVDAADLARDRLRNLARWDRNGDGRITRAEWSGAELGFRTLDLDGNGVLEGRDRALAPPPRDDDTDLRELLAVFKTTVAGKEALLERHDRNKDGELSRAEAASGKLAKLFDRADRNGDGKLDGDELDRVAAAINAEVRRRNMGNARPQPYRVPFSGWDKNDDGRIDSNEWLERKELFPRIDADRDGGVTAAELARYERSIEGESFGERFDLNGDGKVTLEEFGGPRDAFRRADRNGDGVVNGRDR